MGKLEDFLAYLTARNQSKNYFNSMRVFYVYLDKNNLTFEQVTQNVLTNFFNSNEYKSNSKNQFIKSGRSYGDYLQIPKENNPFYQIKLISVEYRIPDFLISQEIEELKKQLKTYNSNKYSIYKIEAMIDFLFGTAIRKAELLNLKRVDFDLNNNKCKVFGKGKKERYVYFNDKVKNEIEIYFNSELENINAFNITIGKLGYLVKLMSKYLHKKVYLHLLRHSGARNMVMKDIPVTIISKILGHSSTQSTLRYIDPSEQMIADKYKEKMR